MDELKDLSRRLSILEGAYNNNNFSSLQVFLKSIEVQGSLILKEYATDPAPAREGSVAYVNGVFRGCTVGGASPTWVTLG